MNTSSQDYFEFRVLTAHASIVNVPSFVGREILLDGKLRTVDRVAFLKDSTKDSYYEEYDSIETISRTHYMIHVLPIALS